MPRLRSDLQCSARVCLAATPDDCNTLRKHGHRPEAKTCLRSARTIARRLYSRRRLLGPGNIRRRRTTNFAPPSRNLQTTPCTACAGGACFTSASTITDADNLFEEAIKLRSQKRASVSGPRARQRRRLRRQSHRVRHESAGARSQAGGSARIDGQSRAGRFRHEAAIEQADEAIAAFSRCARCHGHSRRR